MLFKYKILNFILFPLVFSIAIMNYETWSRSNGAAETAAQKPEAGLESVSKKEASAVKKEPESSRSFHVIAEKNIFNPERKDFPPPEANLAGQPRPAARPQVILYGVIIADNYQSASVSSPGRALRKGERETMIIRPGERIGEYKLARIAVDRITMEAAGDSFEVLLYDPKKPKIKVEAKAEGSPLALKNPRPAPPVQPVAGIAKVETAAKPLQPAGEGVIHPVSPFGRKEALLSSIKRGMAMRQSIMDSNRQNIGIVKSPLANRANSPALGKQIQQ